jgi:Flp pilus assembly protein CpaB
VRVIVPPLGIGMKVMILALAVTVTVNAVPGTGDFVTAGDVVRVAIWAYCFLAKVFAWPLAQQSPTSSLRATVLAAPEVFWAT